MSEEVVELQTNDQAIAELDRRSAARQAEKAERDDAVAEKRKAAAAAMAELEAEAEDEENDDEPQKPEIKAKKAQAKNEDDDAEDADVEEDSDDDEATDEEAEDEPAAKVVRIDGKDVEIPKGTPRALVESVTKLAADLKADHTRKTTEIAEARKSAAQRVQEAEQMVVQTQRAQQAVAQLAQQMIGNPPPLELAQQDPGSYMVQKALYEQRVANLQALTHHGQGLTQAQQRQADAQRQEALAEESQKMVEKIPELADLKARRAFLQRAVSSAEQSGFTADDVAGVADHRMLHLIHRLVSAEAKLAAFEQAGTSVSKKLANVAPKSLRPGVSIDQTQQARDRNMKAKKAFMAGPRDMKSALAYLNARG